MGAIETITEDINNNLVKTKYKVELVWRNIILMSILHIAAVYGFVVGIKDANVLTVIFSFWVGFLSTMGIQVGAHRLWTHRSFKAKLPLKLILVFAQTLALQDDIYQWSRDHRVHHKYSETDADPHNAKRGFFFAHIGWLFCKKHPDVKEKAKTINFDDLNNDPLLQFQRKYYLPLVLLIWGYIPAAIPVYFWGESWTNAIFLNLFRYVVVLNYTWLINSAGHMWGMKPYDKQINPVESYVRHLQNGEGFHNFHHTFAWDYSASEFGAKDVFNPATLFIDFFAWIGWAYDLKKVPEQTIRKKMSEVGIKEHGNLYKSSTPSALKEWIFGSISLSSLWLIICTIKIYQSNYQVK